MNKPDRTSYRYRYGANQEIKDILQSAKRLQSEHLSQNQEIYFEPVSIYYLCAQLLEIAQIPENPHLLQSLQEKYEKAKMKNGKGLLFSLEELFSEGWLQCTNEEWLWNNRPYEYERLTLFCNQKEEQIVKFLKSLKETPYKDGIYPRIYEDNTEFCNLLKNTGLSVEWLIEKKILIRKENALYINSFSHEWEDYGERALSKKYEEWNCIEDHEQLKKWIHYCEFFTRCWRPEKYISEKDALFEYCIKKLEREMSSWEQEESLISRAMQIASNRLQEKYTLSIPQYGAERQKFIRIYFERWCRLEDMHSRRNIYYGICTRNYPILGSELQQRFREILKKPCFEVQYFHLIHWENESCTADCVGEADLFLPAICNLFHYIVNTNQKDEFKNLYVKQLVKPVWDICYNGLHQSDKKSWIRNLAELLVYLYDEGDFYRSRVQSRFFANNYKDFFTKILQLYFTDISEYDEVDKGLIEYMQERLNNAKDHSAQKYLGALMCLGKDEVLYDESVERREKFLKGLFRSLMDWIKLAKERDVLLSTISWNFFSEAVWKETIVQNQETLIEYFTMLDMLELENAKIYNPEKNVIFSVGHLALLGLYFKALCLTELRESLSVEIKDFVENNFVKEFISCQNKWRLFSGENIRLGESSIVLSKCMHALSFLSEENKNTFVENIKVETAIDVAFWLEYVRNQFIKDKLLNVLLASQKDKVFEGIYFFPTWKLAVDNLLELCFAESENEDKKSKAVEKILEYVEYGLVDFEEALSRKPESVRNDYKEWLESAYCRVMLLKNQKEELFSSNHEFYKGLVWLNSDKLEDLQKAKALYKQSGEGSVSCQSNYLIACVLEIVKKKELEMDYDAELHNYEVKFVNYVTTVRELYPKGLYTAYLYGLFLYLSLDKEEKFWGLYEQMPEELCQDKKISIYIIEMYFSSGKISEAKEQLEQLQSIYGETLGIEKLREKIEKSDGSKQVIDKPPVQGNAESSVINWREMRHLLFGLAQEPDHFLADVMVSEREFSRLNDRKMNDKHEVQVISMVCQALKTLQDYSVNLLHNNQVSTEDAYNRTLKMFFNLREERFLGFRLEEQTQGGTTGAIYCSGEQGVGRRDLRLIRNARTVALLEGIKLWRIEKKKIEEHIGKLRKYNAERAPIVVMPIYGHMPDEKGFWERYVNLLYEYKSKRMFDIDEVEEADEFLKTEFAAQLQYIVRTRHNYNEFSVVVYHVMINITDK